MAKVNRRYWRLGYVVLPWVAVTTLVGGALANAVPYPLPPGYLSSYDHGYDTMTPKVGQKYFLTPSSDLYPVCYDELRIAKSINASEDSAGFVAGCVDAARHAMGIFYPCDRNGDDPVCPRRR